MRPFSDTRAPAAAPGRRTTLASLMAAALELAGRDPAVSGRTPSAGGPARTATTPAVPTDRAAQARAMTSPALAAAEAAGTTRAAQGAAAALAAAQRAADVGRTSSRSLAAGTTSAVPVAPSGASAPPGRPVSGAGRGSSSGTASAPRPGASVTGIGGFAAAAAATRPSAPGVFVDDPVLHLARRATMGPRPGDLTDIRGLGIDFWLAQQLDPATPDPEGDAAWALYPLAGADAPTIHAKVAQFGWDAMFATAQATLARQIFSRRPLYEVVVDVFSDHLHVAVPGDGWDTSPSFVSDVVRPYALGRYRDMLLAAMRHPGMLAYLNNDVSSAVLVNENLGRELLELHTVGRDAGYTEADVVASAKVLTGRSQTNGTFAYKPGLHWVGPLAVLGWSSRNATAAGGLAVGDDYLSYLAGHPATARTIARKLAVRFVADNPPPALVDRLAAAYLAHDTSIRDVLVELFRSPEFWASVGQKTRRPLEDLVGAARVLDVRPGSDTATVVTTLYWVVRAGGHAPLGWGPPNGYPDVAAAWGNAGSFVQRMTAHRALVNSWWPGMTTTPVLSLAPLAPGMTAAQWVDALSERLLGQRMAPAHRDAVVAFAPQVTPTTSAVNASWYAWNLVPLLLDSPYFQLR